MSVASQNFTLPSAWGTGRESESISSGNGEMAAAVLSPGGVFINKNKKKNWSTLTTSSTFPLPTPICVSSKAPPNSTAFN